MDDPASNMLVGVGRSLEQQHICTLFANAANQARLLGRLEALPTDSRAWVVSMDNLDSALEWCENRILLNLRKRAASEQEVPLVEHEMCKGLTAEEFQRLRSKLIRMTFREGETVVHQGDPGDYIYFLVMGEVTVTVGDPGNPIRVSTLSPGMVFGEMAAIDRQPRSADVRADSEVACYALPVPEFDRLGKSDPKLKAILLENILRHVSGMLRRLNGEVSTLVR